RKAPLPTATTTRVMDALSKALDVPQTLRQQRLLNLVLKAGGADGKDRLHKFLSTADAYHQLRLAVTWLELDRAAKSEILQAIRVEDVTAEMTKALDTARAETVSLPEMHQGRYITDEFSSE